MIKFTFFGDFYVLKKIFKILNIKIKQIKIKMQKVSKGGDVVDLVVVYQQIFLAQTDQAHPTKNEMERKKSEKKQKQRAQVRTQDMGLTSALLCHWGGYTSIIFTETKITYYKMRPMPCFIFFLKLWPDIL